MRINGRDDVKKGATIEEVRLTIEDIDAMECFKKLSTQQKLELILLVYDLSIALYHSYFRQYE
jgi:hypothetical protein